VQTYVDRLSGPVVVRNLIGVTARTKDDPVVVARLTQPGTHLLLAGQRRTPGQPRGREVDAGQQRPLEGPGDLVGQRVTGEADGGGHRRAGRRLADSPHAERPIDRPPERGVDGVRHRPHQLVVDPVRGDLETHPHRHPYRRHVSASRAAVSWASVAST
jgi:hypothetical protein